MKFKPEYILALLLMAPTVKVQAHGNIRLMGSTGNLCCTLSGKQYFCSSLP